MIYITGEISEESFIEFHKIMRVQGSANKSKKVHLYITSEGGSTYYALAYYDLIRKYQSQGIKFTATATGYIASAATLIYLACDIRQITKNAWMMIHEDSTTVKNLSTTEFEIQSRHNRIVEDQWAQLVSECTGQSKSYIAILHNRERHLNSKKCLELNFATEIV